VSRAERDKGRKGEREVASIFEVAGLEVRGLEGAGDHLIVCGAGEGLVLHSEVKRQETARPWAWWEQASSEAPAGTVAVVTFRRNRSPWLSMLETERLAAILAGRRALESQLAEARELLGRSR
jgi:Holliday junction resolvase